MDRRFSEAEAHAVFARAARRQEAVREADERARAGLTLAELQAVGAEVGIDPSHVEAAAWALDAGEPEPAATFLGVPERLHVVRTLPAPPGDAAWVALVDALRQSFGHAGAVEQLGARRTWSMPDVVTSGGLSVRVEDDALTLEQSLPARSWYASALLPAALVVFFLVGTFEPYVPLAMLVLALVAVVGARFGLPAWARRQERRFQAAVDHVELSMLRAQSELRDAAAQGPPSEASHADPVERAGRGPASGRLDPNALDDPSVGEDRSRARGRERS